MRIMVIGFWMALAIACLSVISQTEALECPKCTEVPPGSPSEVRIEYRDGTSRSACGIRCAGAMLAAYREKFVKTIWVRERESRNLIDARKAVWVIGPGDDHREAFSRKVDAKSFSEDHGGSVKNFGAMMSDLFSGMYDAIRKAHPETDKKISDAVAAHHKCAYCGMDLKRYAYSKVILKYSDGSETGLCSVHCAGIDLALHPERGAVRVLVGTYDHENSVDAEKAVWVLGGSKYGVMSIRGKWAFEKKEDAEAFVNKFGGSITGFRDIMTAAFEDMWEIVR